MQGPSQETSVVVRDSSLLGASGFIDASKEVRNLLEFLYLDVKVRSPAEI